jgi:hypothetical protein
MQILQRASVRLAETAANPRGDFMAALLGGGDSRLTLDPATGLNKYLCQPYPDDAVTCFSSCTASPISMPGFEQAYCCYQEVTGPDGRTFCREAFATWHSKVERALHAVTGGDGLASVVLLPSGTDALLYTSLLLSLESPGRRFTPILPSASETGTGVPLAARCRLFDGPAAESILRDGWDAPVEVPLRGPDGMPLSDDAINAGFAQAVRAAPGRPVAYLTLGTKTGLVAPLEVPRGAEVVVDACQFRAAPSPLQACLRLGWPVIVTGSKYLGGPPFSGAILLPRGRFDAVQQQARQIWYRARTKAGPTNDCAAMIGPLLRWVAAVPRDRPRASARVHGSLAGFRADIEAALAALPGLRIIPGASESMIAASGMDPSIVTFAVRSGRSGEWLAASALRDTHRGLAARGVLVGQPVGLGRFGGLRIAVGGRDVARGTIGPGLTLLTAELADMLCGARPAPLVAGSTGRTGWTVPVPPDPPSVL